MGKGWKFVGDIDIDDIDFVALTLYLKGTLWTGDKPLCKGLREKGFTKVFETAQIKAMTLKF